MRGGSGLTIVVRAGIGAVIGLGHAALAAAARPAWQGYAGNSQHSAAAPARTQDIARIHWQTPVDLVPQYTGGELFIHYPSPMITAANTVLLAVKTTATGDFRIEAHNASTGAVLWTALSNYVPPVASWVPVYPATLTPGGRLYYGQAGGAVAYRDSPDAATGTGGSIIFYGAATPDSSITIDTPLTSDAAGNIYFGYLGGDGAKDRHSGIARISAAGVGSYVTIAAAAAITKDSSLTSVAFNAAPAVSHDGKKIYVPVTNGANGYLLALDATTLATTGAVQLRDPASRQPAWLLDESSASPSIGPNGDVFFGVLESPADHHLRGWLLHYNAALTKTRTPGSFGWDSTASMVPASAVSGYTGTSSYLLFTKYNNYIEAGGAGDNRIAVLDPDATQADTYIPTVKVMKEVKTLLGPTAFPGVAGAVYEWCINAGDVDAAGKAIIANSEDGHMYRFDLTTGTASQSLKLNVPQPEAYTPTLSGPDGQIYAINNGILYAVGK